MGYNTNFAGSIKIRNFTAEKASKLSKVLGEDVRDHKIFTHRELETLGYTFHCDLELDGDALVWNMSEKTYGMQEWLVLLARKFDLDLSGSFLCQGEDIEDRYKLAADGKKVVRVSLD